MQGGMHLACSTVNAVLLFRHWRGIRKAKLRVFRCLLQNKSTSTPTSPGPRTHSTPSIPVLTAGQSGLYSPQYISYIPQIHMGPAVQVRETEPGLE